MFEYDTEHNNIYVDEKPRGEVKEGALDIEFYGGKPEEKDTIQVFNDKGNIYIKAGKNVTVLDDKIEKKIIFRGAERQSEEEQPARRVPNFTKSTAKRNGRLFTAGSIFKLFRSDGTERAYSIVIAAVLCFLSLMAFEAANTRIENKVLDSNSVYVNMNTYADLRTLDTSLYDSIDFFETQYKQGGFSYNEIASLSGISADRRTIRRRAWDLPTAKCRRRGRCLFLVLWQKRSKRSSVFRNWLQTARCFSPCSRENTA